MLRSLLHDTGTTLLFIMSLTVITLCSSANADIDIHSMNHEELLESVAVLDNSSYALDMHETSTYYEGNEALQELAENALKSFWKVLVRNDPSFNLYTPIVSGQLAINRNGANYGIRLSGNTIKLRFEYAF